MKRKWEEIKSVQSGKNEITVPNHWLHKTVLLFSVCVYLFSLSQIGFYDDHHSDDVGAALVLFGFFAMTSGGAALTWLANPFLWYAWLRARDIKASFTGSIMSTLISLFFLAFNSIPGTCTGTDMHTVDCDVKISSYGLGYYLWLLSSVIMLTRNCIELRRRHKKYFITG